MIRKTVEEWRPIVEKAKKHVAAGLGSYQSYAPTVGLTPDQLYCAVAKVRQADKANGSYKKNPSGKLVEFAPVSEARINLYMDGVSISVARGDNESLKAVILALKELKA